MDGWMKRRQRSTKKRWLPVGCSKLYEELYVHLYLRPYKVGTSGGNGKASETRADGLVFCW
jgi:hypothetical protein